MERGQREKGKGKSTSKEEKGKREEGKGKIEREQKIEK